MKILWLINIPLPEASLLLNEKPLPFGGWLLGLSEVLSFSENTNLSVAFPHKGIKEYRKLSGERIDYYAFSPIKTDDAESTSNIELFQNIINDANPNIVHIHGTELAHSLTMIKTCELNDVNSVISIQGLVSKIAKHMYASLPNKAIFGFTLRNFINRDNIFWMKKSFQKRGNNEIEALKRAFHIIGRTTWDRAVTKQTNPQAEYYFCNETLRGEFYKHQWSIDNCEKHSIFISQGQYTYKGVHYMLEAMPLILKRYPEAKVYIGGKDITKSNSMKDKILMTYYGMYIKKKIKNLRLERNVIFAGPLDEKKMCQRYLKSHVFVCPSSIENSSNSLGEAMMLGVPSVASAVGGIPDMLVDKEEGFLYQHDAPYMLAYYVCEIFERNDLALRFSKNARQHALKTHDKDENIRTLIEIYNNILEIKLEK